MKLKERVSKLEERVSKLEEIVQFLLEHDKNDVVVGYTGFGCYGLTYIYDGELKTRKYVFSVYELPCVIENNKKYAIIKTNVFDRDVYCKLDKARGVTVDITEEYKKNKEKKNGNTTQQN